MMISAATPTTPMSCSKSDKKPPSSTPRGTRTKEEKIFVTVRVRPLSNKEQALKDHVAWECVYDNTVVFKSSNQDRSNSTSSHTFDRVFGPACPTEIVYEEGAKDVALSALTGINATIFAYGQTSSGKTYTMRGITENAVNDIYSHIQNTPEREFVIKLSALEIYNEVVKDLLNPESGPLRLLDDPEQGTVVEKLEEETARDSQHLRQLIAVCEAQRQVGETALNDTSSRSHQIIRLSIESTLRENYGCLKSYIATLNFVDLAGSERASQTNADGARLKEGCHINRSLLTLTTVIRKLSAGKRGGHIPYRDSKLTRILQTSLGGNARTAIICTMSPAFTHVEQSRNTLYFAARAKEVTNNAQVNMLVSDKQLVKHLQKEVARLEAELRTPEPTKTTDAMLREKELQIKKMETEMEELKRQRDLAQSQLQALHRTLDLNNNPKTPTARCLSFSIPTRNPTRQSATDPITLVSEIRKLEHLQLQLGEEATRALEVLQKKAGSEEAALAIAKLESEIKTMRAAGRPSDDDAQKISAVGSKANLKEEITRLHSQESAIATLEEKLENVQRSLDKMLESIPEMESRKRTKKKGKKTILPLPLSGSSSANVQSLLLSPCSPMAEDETENRTPDDGTPPGRQRRTSSVNMRKMQRLFQNAAEENIRSIKAYVTELKERVAKLQYQKQLLVCQVLELEANEGEYEQSGVEMVCSPEAWSSVFKEQRRQILRLWDVCHVSIVHRTQFYQLFRGDPDDQIYMEVELRRLTWLRHHFLEACNRSPAPTGDEPQNLASLASSARALRQERELLAKRMITRMTAEERAGMYQRWAVAMDSKQRRMQVANKLWTDPADAENVEESAHLVARLVGLGEGGEPVPKEMFELNLALPEARRPWLLIWNPIQNLLRA
ncbi:ATP binding microtubule motor family protein [Wolffia australiana]